MILHLKRWSCDLRTAATPSLQNDAARRSL
jgi:hypothetical protein